MDDNIFEAGAQLETLAGLSNSAEHRRTAWRGITERIRELLANVVAEVNSLAEERRVMIASTPFGFTDVKLVPTRWDDIKGIQVGLSTESPRLQQSFTTNRDGEDFQTVANLVVTEPALVFTPGIDGRIRVVAHLHELQLDGKVLGPKPSPEVLLTRDPKELLDGKDIAAVVNDFLRRVVKFHWTTRA